MSDETQGHVGFMQARDAPPDRTFKSPPVMTHVEQLDKESEALHRAFDVLMERIDRVLLPEPPQLAVAEPGPRDQTPSSHVAGELGMVLHRLMVLEARIHSVAERVHL